MRIKLISELTRGDLFIWGSDTTRRNMCVHGEDLGPLIFTRIELITAGSSIYGSVFWLPKSCKENSRYFVKSDIVLVADYENSDLSNFVHHDVKCDNCGERFGRHRQLDCPNGGYFVPNQADLEALHPSYKIALRGEDSDFFDSIGL